MNDEGECVQSCLNGLFFFCAEINPSSSQRVTQHRGIQKQRFYTSNISINVHEQKINDDWCSMQTYCLLTW